MLKNGSRFYGHTSKEDFVNNTTSFMADSAIVVESIDKIFYSEPEPRAVSGMKNNWSDWFDRHPEKTFTNNGRKSAWLGNISYIGNPEHSLNGDAIILEQGNDSITFFTINQTSVEYNQNSIDHFEYATRDSLDYVGVIDEIVLFDGKEFVGQIVEKFPQKIVLLTDNGVRRVIQCKDIKAKRKLPYNPNYSLFRQLRFLSRIYLNSDAENNYVDGVVRAIVYEPGSRNGHYEVIYNNDSSPRQFAFDKVKEIKASANREFIREKDIRINGGEIFVEKIPAKSMKSTKMPDRYIISDSVGVIDVNFSELDDGMIKIYYKDLPENNNLIFTEAQIVDVPDATKTDKKNGDANVSWPSYYVNMSDMVFNIFTPMDRSVSPAGNVSVSYGKVEAGKYYLLMRRSDETTYIIKVN